MAIATFKHSRITGLSTVVPDREIRLEDETAYYGGDARKVQRLSRMTGLAARRVLDSDATAADLCEQAAKTLLDGCGTPPAQIDALIFISQSPDYRCPATACILQEKLGLSEHCAAFDVNQGCSGYVYGLWLASSLVESGAARKVLLLVGEGQSRLTTPAGNRITGMVFGDAGSATLVEYCPEERPSHFSLGTRGGGYDALIIPGGQARIPLLPEPAENSPLVEPVADASGTAWSLTQLYMDGGRVFNFTLDVVPADLRELLARAHASPAQVDFLVLHQANLQIIAAVAEKAGFPLEKTPHRALSRYGNLSGASIPSVLCDELAGRISGGHPVRLLLSGFGIGLSWASCLLDMENVFCAGVTEFSPPANLQTRAQRIASWRKHLAGD